jgi:hypothetical protein
MIEQKYIEHLNNSFNLAETNTSMIDDYIKNIDGMSGEMTRHLYNNILNFEDARYLEIGTWKGSTICSAMVGNQATVLCIDNWSEFGGPKNEFIKNFTKYKGNNKAEFLEQDCFTVDVNEINQFTIYMYDGEHSYNSHYKALTHYYDVLDEIFIFIVDDWNWKQVRDATIDSINSLKLDIIWQKEIKLDNNNETTSNKLTWWNGIAVFLLKKTK